MRKYRILLIVLPFLMFSCMVDESEYTIQEKEDVDVDQIAVDTTTGEEVLPERQLVPGVHLVTLKVPVEPNSLDSIERQFKYYMPVTLNSAESVSLLFEFHGSYEFDKGEGIPNPIADIQETSALNQKALKENFVICYPVGETIIHADSSGVINWQNSEKHFPFVDAMVKYFTEDNEPRIDPKRIYSTGQSSGAIFSFVLAFERSDIFASIVPRAGQMSLSEVTTMPQRAVPVRVFAGVEDTIVIHSAVLQNMTDWAEQIGGYFSSDMQMDTTSYEDVRDMIDVTIRYWHGGKADYEIYSLAGIGHGIPLSDDLVDDMWEFMESHTMDNASTQLFVTTDVKEIEAQCGEPITIQLSYSEGAELEMTGAPKGWNAQLDGTQVTMTAPADYFGNIDREGAITFTVTSGTQEPATCEVTYYLEAPKTYFEVGDIYYNENFEPQGVVFWVNPENIREAKIVGLQEARIKLGDFGPDFITPDQDNGSANTAAYVEQNNTLDSPYSNRESAVIWASEYNGEQEWYLPAINELLEIFGKAAAINESLESIGALTLPSGGYCLSSTVDMVDGRKSYYEVNCGQASIQIEINQYADTSRAVRKVTKE